MNIKDIKPLAKVQEYTQALRLGIDWKIEQIEKENGLYGYPPELVSYGLEVLENGGDPHEVIMMEWQNATGEDY